jgi:NitT/TauT family transport system substrate-binding protein
MAQFKLSSTEIFTEYPVLSRRNLLAASAALVISGAGMDGIGAVANAETRKPERTALTLAVNGKQTLQYLPLTIAEQFGWFKAEGVDLVITDMASSTRTWQAIASGTADMVCGAYDQVLNLQARNQNAQSFVVMGLAPQIAFGYSVRTMAGSPQLIDLRGKKIGVAAPGTPSHMVASHIVSRAGLAQSDVSYISVGSSAGAMAALRSGQIDALCNGDPVMTSLTQRGEVQIAVDVRTVHGTADVFGGPLPTACLSASSDFVQKHPQTIQAMTTGIVKALKWLQNCGSSDLLKVVPEAYLLGDRALYLDTFHQMREAISHDGVMPEDGPRTALKALLRFDASQIRAGQVDLARSFTNEYAKRAAALVKQLA